jgi:hypothetical protein
MHVGMRLANQGHQGKAKPQPNVASSQHVLDLLILRNWHRLCLTRIGNRQKEPEKQKHGVSVCCPHCGLATALTRVSAPRRCITVFSFIGLNGARVGVRQPVFHVPCHRRAHAR